MIGLTNDGFGLLRVLGPDLTWALATTLVIVTVVLLVNHFIGAAGEANPDIPAADVARSRRNIRRVAWWVWIVVVIGFVWHAATTTASLRIPRSDVDATGVYQRMDGLTQGNPR